MIVQRGVAPRAVRSGTTTCPPGSPSATSSTGASGVAIVRADLLDEHVLGDAIDRINRVPFLLASDSREGARRHPLARLDDVAADASMQGLNRREERVGDRHDDCDR